MGWTNVYQSPISLDFYRSPPQKQRLLGQTGKLLIKFLVFSRIWGSLAFVHWLPAGSWISLLSLFKQGLQAALVVGNMQKRSELHPCLGFLIPPPPPPRVCFTSRRSYSSPSTEILIRILELLMLLMVCNESMVRGALSWIRNRFLPK